MSEDEFDTYDYYIGRAEDEIKEDISRILPELKELKQKREQQIKVLQRDYYIKELESKYDDFTFIIDGVRHVYLTNENFEFVLDTIESDDEAESQNPRIKSFVYKLDVILKNYRLQFERVIDTKTCMHALYPMFDSVYEKRKVKGCTYLTEDHYLGEKPVLLCTSKRTDEVEIPFDINSVEDVKISWGHV